MPILSPMLDPLLPALMMEPTAAAMLPEILNAGKFALLMLPMNAPAIERKKNDHLTKS